MRCRRHRVPLFTQLSLPSSARSLSFVSSSLALFSKYKNASFGKLSPYNRPLFPTSTVCAACSIHTVKSFTVLHISFTTQKRYSGTYRQKLRFRPKKTVRNCMQYYALQLLMYRILHQLDKTTEGRLTTRRRIHEMMDSREWYMSIMGLISCCTPSKVPLQLDDSSRFPGRQALLQGPLQ